MSKYTLYKISFSSMLVSSNPLSVHSILSLCCDKLLIAVWWFFTTLKWGREGNEVCFTNKNRLRYIRRNVLTEDNSLMDLVVT